jgi:hypothetical protein
MQFDNRDDACHFFHFYGFLAGVEVIVTHTFRIANKKRNNEIVKVEVKCHCYGKPRKKKTKGDEEDEIEVEERKKTKGQEENKCIDQNKLPGSDGCQGGEWKMDNNKIRAKPQPSTIPLGQRTTIQWT